MTDDLQARVERIEAELGIEAEPEWDNPWSWSWDHTKVLTTSGFEFGVDKDGDLLIKQDGYIRCIAGSLFNDVVEALADV